MGSEMCIRDSQFTALPAVSQAYQFYDIETAQKSRDKIFSSHIPFHDRGTGFLPDLTPGEQVVIQHPKTGQWSQRGVIISVRSSGQSYEVNCDGRVCVRARKLLRPDPLACSVSSGIYHSSAVPSRPVVPSVPPASDRGYVDTSDQGSRRPIWDPHRLSQSQSTMTKLSSSPQDRTQEIVSPIKTELSISQGPLLCSSGIGPASVEASLPFSSASSSAYCSVSSSGRTIGPIPELGDQSFTRSCCLQGEATMLDQGGISSPVCTPPVQGTQGRLSGIVDAPMSLPHHILHRSNPVPQPSTLASHLGNPCLPVSPVCPSIPAVVSPYIPPVYPNYPGPPMGPPFPSQESRLPFRVQPPCLPLSLIHI